MTIHILSEEVTAKIAAGEVIERPGSVVKELVENAIDSGATVIGVSVMESGFYTIEITDNGSGIAQSEIGLALARHATSKIQKAEDLYAIRTLGFRGEALASIAAVSRLIITSKRKDENLGAQLIAENGKIEKISPIGGMDGTTVRVSNILANVPARLKFLKSSITEKRFISKLIEKFAIAYPDVSFNLHIDGKSHITTTGNGVRREVLKAIIGYENAKKLLDVEFEEQDYAIQGFVSPPGLSRSNRNEISFFVNGRWVQNTALGAALIRAFHTYLMVGRFPMSWLFLKIPPRDIDVNVHPTKAEVRFKNADQIFSFVQRAIRLALLGSGVTPANEGLLWQTRSNPSGIDKQTISNFDFQEKILDNHEGQSPEDLDVRQPVRQMESIPRIPLLRLVGQVGSTYLVAEGPDGLYLIDQHAAHERILYEKLMKNKTNPASQALLEPVIIQGVFENEESSEIIISKLQKMGFKVERFGPDEIIVRGIPEILKGINMNEVLSTLLDSGEKSNLVDDQSEDELTKQICKKMAVKAGKLLSVMEQERLLRDLEACESPRTCPHGRPTMIHLSVDVLERQFGRRGSL